MSKKADVQNIDPVAQAREQAAALMKQFTQNEVHLGAMLSDVKLIEGKEMKDKETGEPIVDEFGEIRRFPDSYYAVLSFMGGTLETAITAEQYNALQGKIGKNFNCKGVLAKVRRFGQDEILPKFHTFIEL